MKQTAFYILIFVLLISSVAFAQVSFTRQLNVPVQVGANFLKLPWAGGLNFPLFSEFDFNQDGTKDLFIFERVNNRIICFVNQGTPNQVDYIFDPQYFHMFPKAEYWAFTHDYNCDGQYDFFTLDSMYRGIKVYRNDSIGPGSFLFTLASSELMCQYPSTVTNIPAAYGLYPAFSDMDNDGDMDILALNSNNPGLIEYDKNISEESLYGCDSLKFQYVTTCWGDMKLPPVSVNCADTGMMCRTGWFQDDGLKFNANNTDFKIDYYDQSDAARHDDTMSCICVIDIENDTDKDLLIGGLGESNEQMTRNGGIPVAAHIDSLDCLWPSYDTPIQINSFPCAANIDVDNDGKKDVIAAPTTGNDFTGIWYYHDTSTTNIPGFKFQHSAFLQQEMIEVGTGSYPAFFDYDADGFNDIIIGNYNYFQTAGTCKSGLSLYRNTGTNTNPSFLLITRDYAGLFNATFCNGFCNDAHPTFGDIDGDGDLDMLVGDYCGHLQLFLNSGGAGNPANFGNLGIPSVPNYQAISAGGISAAPQLIDLDRDGKLDLILGKRNGFITYYHNTGTTTSAVFTLVTDTLGHVDVSYLTSGYSCPFIYDDSGSYRLLVGNELGYVFRYGNIDGNLSGTFTVLDTVIDRVEGGRVCPGMGDVNGDGFPDLLVGNYAGGISLFYRDNPLSTNFHNATEAGPGMEIFPNPANGQTEIQFSNLNPNNKTVLNVFDVTGQKIISLPCSDSSLTLNISMMGAGIYMLRLEDGKHSVVRKLMVY